MLLEKGFNQASVTIDEKIENGQIALAIQVDAGPKTRIYQVVFPGLDTKLLSAGFLRRGMKNNQNHSLLSGIFGKDIYNREKINEDLEEVRLRFQQKGYLEAKVGSPEFSWVTQKTVMGKLQKMLILSIPVEMGPRYLTGNITIEGNKVIRGDFLKQMITLKKGDVFNIKKSNKAVEDIQKFYGSIGYFYAQVAPRENLDPVKQHRRPDRHCPGKRRGVSGKTRIYRQHVHQRSCHPPRMVPARGATTEHQRPGGFHQEDEAAGFGDH